MILLFILSFINFVSSENGLNEVRLVIIPSEKIIRSPGTNLTLTCKIEPLLSVDFKISWTLPEHLQSSVKPSRISYTEARNMVSFTINSLSSADSGYYHCEAFNQGSDFRRTVYVNVTSPQNQSKCIHMFDTFKCEDGHGCILHRLRCDNFKDCPDGSDESPKTCGEDACKWKIKCRDGRCYDETKLTKYCKDDFLTHKIPCCDEFNLDADDPTLSTNPWKDEFLQSTIYTIASCALAVFFFVAILVVAVYRVHMRRSLLLALRTSTTNRPFQRRSDPTLPCWMDSTSGELCENNDHNDLQHSLNSGLEDMWATISQMPKPPPNYSESLKPLPYNEPPPPYTEHKLDYNTQNVSSPSHHHALDPIYPTTLPSRFTNPDQVTNPNIN